MHSPYFVILLSIFPILFIFTNNIFMVSIDELILPLTISILFSIILWFILKYILKNGRKSAIIVSLFLILFFSYGHLFIAANGVEFGIFDTSKHYYFVIPFVIIFAIGTFLTIRTKRKLDNAITIGNGIAITLILIASVNIGTYSIQNIETTSNSNLGIFDTQNNSKSDLPDIYYIILDGYANSETLQQEYNFDNSDFINYLKTKNFVIPQNTHGNYPLTFMALASSLNMKYVNEESGFDSKDEAQISGQKLIQNNDVMKQLKSKGYSIISFDTGSWYTNSIRLADWHVCGMNSLNSEFVSMIVRTTMLYPIHVKLLASDVREGILCIFDELPKLTDRTQKPIFVFAHIIIPHPPYIFDKDGNLPDVDSLSLTSGWDDQIGYVEQLQFANTKVKHVVNEILSKDKSSIIIIQSDHGPRAIDWENPDENMIRMVFGIFNAYYLPNDGDQKIYDSITPVNSFRILFNYYFDENFELLDDNAFFSSAEEPDRFEDVSELLEN